MQLEKRNKKILVICPHPEGFVPGQRLKYEQYFDNWRQNGFDVQVSSFMSESMQQIVYKKGFFIQKILGTIKGYLRRTTDLFRIKQYDIVYLFLWATPFGPPFFEWMIRNLAHKIVYDIDDLVFLKNIHHENRILAFFKGKQKPVFMMKHADHVIACTPYLEKIAKRYNRNTTDISSTINTETYIPVNKYKNDHQLVLGWSGSHSTSQYLYLLKDALIKLKKSVDFKLLVMGDTSFKMEGIDTEIVEWSKDQEIPVLQRIDIGLYPLPLNDEWVLGKSGLKALQYMALGIPTIASNVGCNDRVISDGIDGFLVKSEEEWVGVLTKLMNDELLRERIGKKARKKVENQFSLESNCHRYTAILKQ